VLSFPGVAAERAERLRALADVGWAVTIERAIDEGLEVCVIEGRGRYVTGRGATPDEAAADALAQLEDPGA
jgi:hypothetical protein